MAEYILGISAFYHDSAAALLADGEIIAAAQEERFSRQKYDSSFPDQAIEYVIDEGKVSNQDLQTVVFYDKPFIKFERLLTTYHALIPRGLKSFLSAIPVWIKRKLFLKKHLKDELSELGLDKIEFKFPEHHLSHAASAFYPSNFEGAAILTLDGVGEWATTIIGHGQGNSIKKIKQLDFPHSIGLLYSAFTYYCGFRVNSGEYKLMGLASYGNPEKEQVKNYIKLIKQNLVDIRKDGSILLNMDYFNFATSLKMCNDEKWEDLFGIQPRRMEGELLQEYIDLAYAIQSITEEIILKLARTAKSLTKADNLVLAGGVALNCVANGKILQKDIFENIWIQPAAGDAGGSLGAALAEWFIGRNKKRRIEGENDFMKSAYLGPEFHDNDYYNIAKKYEAKFRKFDSTEKLTEEVAEYIKQGEVIGWFQDRMEYGPRALGNRSIIADARDPEMQKKLNLKIKKRENFRPFAPTCLEEDKQKYFELERPSPYMLLAVPVKKDRRKQVPDDYYNRSWSEQLEFIRSDIPGVTHIDFSSRVQTVNQEDNPRFWKLIKQCKIKTGYGIVINTSFNERGEPIVCTPEQAFSCFMRTGIDYLVMGDYLFKKEDLKEVQQNFDWQSDFKLD